MSQETDDRHMLYGYIQQRRRLKSRKSFMATTKAINVKPEIARLNAWESECHEWKTKPWLKPTEEFSVNADLNYARWRSLNRLRTQVGRTGDNLKKWRISESSLCTCNEEQSIAHLFSCKACPVKCSFEDIIKLEGNAIDFLDYWKSVL